MEMALELHSGYIKVTFRLYLANIQIESCLLKCLGKHSYSPHEMTTCFN